MSNQQHGHAAFGLLGEQEIGNLTPGLGIEIAGRLIGDQHQRRRCKGAGNGNPLLFSTGQLPRIVAKALSEPHGRQFTFGDLEGIAHVCQFEWNGNVLQRRHVGNQVKGLKDDADIAPAEIGKRIFGKRMKRFTGYVDFAFVQAFKTGEDHKERRLAGSRRADDADCFASIDLQVYLFQNMHGGCGAAEGKIRLLQLDNGFSQNKASYIELSVTDRSAPRQRKFRKRALRLKAILLHFLVMSAIFLGPASAQQSAVQLVGFGDSLMAGYELAPSESYTAQLETALKATGKDVVVTNAGVSGDTTSGGLSRVDWSVPDGTDGVILELGANDALRGIAPEQSEKNLDSILARLKERNIPVLLVGIMAPPNMGGEYAERFNGIYARLAAKYGVPLYPFFLDGVVTVQGTQLEDGMHPNAKGVGIMVERSLPTVEKFLGDIQNTKK